MKRIWGVLVVVCALGATVLTAGPSQAIVGGTTVPNGAYSFMAALLDGGSQICGGSVIANDWVLTAAHCVPSGNTGTFSVRVGSNDDTTGGSVIPVDQVHFDPLYDGSNFDVAVLHLASSVPLTVAKITLAPVGDDTHEADGTPVTVAGWGDFNPVTMGLLAGPSMNEVQLNVVSDANCGLSGVSADTQVCAAALLKDSCQGDSGGPLFWKGPLGQRIQIGVVSHGLLCAIPEFPGSYSEVNNAQMRAFINTYAPGV